MKNRLNVLQITTHDSGRHFGCYGHPTLQTPAIDNLAANGVRFANYFCTVPICSASRCSQLTGLYPQRHGLLDLVGFGWKLGDDVRHAAQIFKANGYRTFLFGVQHEDLNPKRLGFDVARPVPNNAAAVADAVAAFFQNEAASSLPFYAQIGFFETHTPFDLHNTAPDYEKGVEVPPYLADTASSREAMAGYQGAVRVADAGVETILAALRKSGLEDNTLVVFTTDHGIEMPRSKWHLYDPGVQIAMIMRCPAAGLLGGRECGQLMSNVDYLPTLLDLAGLSVSHKLDGHSFAAILRQETDAPARDAVFGLYHKIQGRYARTERFKLIRYFDNAVDFASVPACIEEALRKRVIERVELFDLQADPVEFNNVANKPEYETTRRELDAMLWKWMESVEDPLLQGPVKSPAYMAAIGDYAAWRSGNPL